MIEKTFENGVAVGRISVLQDFDLMSKADAFVGFTPQEWKAIQKFFAINKELTQWHFAEDDIFEAIIELRK